MNPIIFLKIASVSPKLLKTFTNKEFDTLKNLFLGMRLRSPFYSNILSPEIFRYGGLKANTNLMIDLENLSKNVPALLNQKKFVNQIAEDFQNYFNNIINKHMAESTIEYATKHKVPIIHENIRYPRMVEQALFNIHALFPGKIVPESFFYNPNNLEKILNRMNLLNDLYVHSPALEGNMAKIGIDPFTFLQLVKVHPKLEYLSKTPVIKSLMKIYGV